jgi:hypothetical protein
MVRSEYSMRSKNWYIYILKAFSLTVFLCCCRNISFLQTWSLGPSFHWTEPPWVKSWNISCKVIYDRGNLYLGTNAQGMVSIGLPPLRLEADLAAYSCVSWLSLGSILVSRATANDPACGASTTSRFGAALFLGSALKTPKISGSISSWASTLRPGVGTSTIVAFGWLRPVQCG